MSKINRFLLVIPILIVLIFTSLAEVTAPVLAAPGCASSSPASETYVVTVCFSSPASGSTLSGNATVTATVSVSGTSPGVQRMVFYLDGSYLLTDYQTSYTFILPTNKWVDGSHALSAEALMRDGFISQRGILSVSFSNGITTPPVNTNQFQPSSGVAPVNGMPFTVVAGGDGASGEINAGKVSDLVTSLNPNLFLYLGDVYEKGSKAEFFNWYGTSATNFGRFRSITNPTIGNHEYTSGAAPGYFDYWNNVPNYYSYNAGGWHFISLNSNSANIPVGPQSAQYQWLQQDLAANSGVCTIAYYHHPYFNIGPEGPKTSMVDIWKLMAQYGVDIVINGHDHDYQRWVPLDGNGLPNPNGLTEFVAGASGHGLQTILNSDSRVAYSNDINPAVFGVLVLQLNQNGANFSYQTINGSILDYGVVPCVPSLSDTLAPTMPIEISANSSSATRVNLTWSASSDNTGINGYTIYRNGVSIATVPSINLAYSDTTAMPATTYNYTIDSFDLAGNHSAVSAPAIVTTPSMPASLTFPVAADTYVSASSPTSKYGSALTWRLDASPDLHSYLRFNVQGLAGTPVTQAHLLVYANNTSSLGISARSVADNSWGELTMNYTNAPTMGSVLASSGPISAGSWVSMDVTSYITGEGIYSFGITTPSTSSLSFPSRESGANSAQLIISFTLPPTATPTATATVTSTPIQTNTPTPTAIVPMTPTPTQTSTPTPTSIDVPTQTYTPTSTPTSIVVPTLTSSPTPTPTSIDVPTQTSTPTPTSIDVPTQTSTPTPTATLGQSLTLLPIADAYVNAASVTTNYGASTSLRADASPDVHSYLRFTVPALDGASISQARLLIYATSSSTQGISARIVADNSWAESTINYTNAPILGSNLASSSPVAAGTWVTLDVTSYVSGSGIFNFGVTTPGSTAISLSSRESGANAPQLIIDLH